MKDLFVIFKPFYACTEQKMVHMKILFHTEGGKANGTRREHSSICRYKAKMSE